MVVCSGTPLVQFAMKADSTRLLTSVIKQRSPKCDLVDCDCQGWKTTNEKRFRVISCICCWYRTFVHLFLRCQSKELSFIWSKPLFYAFESRPQWCTEPFFTCRLSRIMILIMIYTLAISWKARIKVSKEFRLFFVYRR